MKLCFSGLFLMVSTLLLILAGCSQTTPTPPASEPSPSEGVLESPLFTSPIPTPKVLVPIAESLLPRDHTPQPGLGIVQGILVINGEPAVGRVLYLAPIIQPSGEGMGVAALDPVADPRATSDASGYFVFLDVQPGQYALGINSPIGPVLINQSGEEILTQVQADQVADLGNVPIVPFHE